jgi:hypothetical protein
VRSLPLLSLLVAGPVLASIAVRMDVSALTAAATDVVDSRVVSSSSSGPATTAGS